MAKGYEAPHESLNVLNVPDLSHISDGRDLIIVRFDVALGDDVPRELVLGDSEGACETPSVTVAATMLKQYLAMYLHVLNEI
jgi:hypothetical protein